jgi:hypothetical protein
MGTTERKAAASATARTTAKATARTTAKARATTGNGTDNGESDDDSGSFATLRMTVFDSLRERRQVPQPTPDWNDRKTGKM